MIGYPEYILRDPGRLNAKYATLEVTPTNYFGNVVRNRQVWPLTQFFSVSFFMKTH